jgi:sodium transport system ATP-binding protein
MSEVEKLCDTVGIIQGGKLLAEGTLEQLRQRHGENDLEEFFVKIVSPHYGAQSRSDMSLRNIGIVYRKELTGRCATNGH